MGKKKDYHSVRDMTSVCPKCYALSTNCSCGFVVETHQTAWVLADKEELEYFHKTGMIPDYQAELLRSNEDTSPPKKRPLEYPPEYSFEV